MFVLDWTAYPFIMLCVALPLAVLYVAERRRERREDAAYVGPCMAHTGTEPDGTELWCWQRVGHRGAHDDYAATDAVAQGLRRLLGCAEMGCLFDVDHDGPHMCGQEGVNMAPGQKCFLPDTHPGEHQPFEDDEPDLITWAQANGTVHTDAGGPLTYVPPQGVCGTELNLHFAPSSCVRAPGHLGECSDF